MSLIFLQRMRWKYFYIIFSVSACLFVFSACEIARVRKQYNAVNPKRIKKEFYVAKLNGDTVRVDYKMDLGTALLFGFSGYPDSIVPIYFYKGKKITGTTLSLDKKEEIDPDSDLMLGTYKTFRTYKNGIPVVTEKYFPNDSIFIRVKGSFKGEFFSELFAQYDQNGRLIKRMIDLPGVNYSEFIKQEQRYLTLPDPLGGDRKEMEVFDSMRAYKHSIKIERNIGYNGYDGFYQEFRNTEYETVLFTREYNEAGELIKQECTYSYGYSYLNDFDSWRKEHDCWKADSSQVKLYADFFEDGSLKVIGQYKDSLRHGTWNYYSRDGKLENIEFYTKGKKHYVLYDENGYIYFSVLYDKEAGKILQYRNDNLPDLCRCNNYVYSYYEFPSSCGEGDRVSFWSEKSYSNQEDLNEEFYLSHLKKDYWPDGKIKSYGFKSLNGGRAGIWIDFSITGDTVLVQDYYDNKSRGLYVRYVNGQMVSYENAWPWWCKGMPNSELERVYRISVDGIMRKKIY